MIEQLPTMLTPIARLNRDAIAAIREGANPLNTESFASSAFANASEARILVDLYYTMQEIRKRLGNQVGAMDRGVDTTATHDCADIVLAQAEQLENNAKTFLEVFASEHPIWPWFKAVHGIGPVLSAGLIAHFGARPVPPTVGHWWRYAGLDPSQKWLKADELNAMWKETSGDIDMRTRIIAKTCGRDPETVIRDATINNKTGEDKPLTKANAIKSLARIPFNRPLRTLCWKCGDQWVKLGARKDAYYARFYRNRKAEEIARNERGDRAKLAAKTLREKPNHAQKAIYEQGKLPDGRIDLMARRATVKLFLSHMHEIWWTLENPGKHLPAPFSITMPGHAHYLAPPHTEVISFTDE